MRLRFVVMGWVAASAMWMVPVHAGPGDAERPVQLKIISDDRPPPGVYGLIEQDNVSWRIAGFSERGLDFLPNERQEVLYLADNFEIYGVAWQHYPGHQVGHLPQVQWECTPALLKKAARSYSPCVSQFTTVNTGRSVGKNIVAAITTMGAASGSWRALQAEEVQRVFNDLQFRARAIAWLFDLELTRAQTSAQVGSIRTRFDAFLGDADQARLADRTRELRVTEERQEFEAAATVGQIDGFLERYNQDDPVGLLPQAGKKRGELVARAEREAREAALREAELTRREAERTRELARAASSFRAHLQEGDQSHCGLVVEVKPNVARVQTMMGEHWFRRDQLFPSGTRECRFVNGAYVD